MRLYLAKCLVTRKVNTDTQGGSREPETQRKDHGGGGGHGEKVAVYRPSTEASGRTAQTPDFALPAFRSMRGFVY